MRLHRLELAGFGPFRERQTVDFDAYADDGIFLISGRTGAGKSSILDGVCFALYGGVPRYTTSDRRLRSDHCEIDDETEVVLELTVGGRRLRVTRSPDYERPKRRGSGTTLEKHRAILEERVDGEWQGLTSGAAEVGRELRDIVGLSQQQFLQVVLLAQNRFAEFLLAGNDERQAVLRTLFGTRRYEDYTADLDSRRREAEARLADRAADIRRRLDDILREGDLAATDDLDAARESAALVVARADYRAESTDLARAAAASAFDEAQTSHATLAAFVERLAARDRSRVELATLESRDLAVAADREALARAMDAEEVRAALDADDRSAHAEADARALLAVALAAVDEPADATDPAAAVEHLTGALATWRSASGAESDLVAAERSREATARRIEEFEETERGIAAQHAAIPPRLQLLDAGLVVDRATAAGLVAATAQVDDLAARLVAAQEAARLAGARSDAERAHAHALDAVTAAAAALTALLRRRLAGHAAELAGALVDGAPCAVCGAVEHPAPATSADDPVSDADLAVAEGAKDAAAAAEASASRVAAVARDEHARAAERAAGATPEELAPALAAAEEAVTAATAASSRAASAETERAELLALADDVDAERARLAASLAAARSELAVLDELIAQSTTVVVAARGPFPSVAERIADGERRRTAAMRLVDAVAARDRCTAAAAAAHADLAERLDVSPFAHPADARAALLERAARETLAEVVAAYDTAVRVERERLLALELEVADLPAGSLDLAEAAARREAARRAWTEAIADATRAAQDARRLRDQLDRAIRDHDGIADLAREVGVVARLAHTVAGRAPNTRRMDLETFVLAAELEEIVQAANLRLADMSAGRYRLAHTDALAARGGASGLGLEVVDAFTGRARPTASLSGGETFLASLALALGLAEVVSARAGGLRLDTLFVDEGFGHLDGETLELAMRTLDELRQGGRTVGVISHVEAMKEQLPAQLVVEALPAGPSVIRQDVRVGA